MPPVEAELHRRNSAGILIPWRLNDDGTDPVADSVVRTRLQEVVTALSGVLTVGGTVTLDAAGLAALESITATLAPGTVVDLPPGTIDALKAVTATVTPAPGTTFDLPSATITALRDVTATLAAGSTINLSAASLAALENITATITGALRIDDATPVRVNVTNAPLTGELSLSAAQIADLKQVAVTNIPDNQRVVRSDFTQIASEATLLSLHDTAFRRTDPLSAGSNMVGRVQLDQAATHFVSPSTAQKVEQQRFFITTSGKLSLTTGGFFRGVFVNPAGSARTIRIVRIASFVSAGPVFAEIYKNPTTGVPTAALRPVTNAHFGAVATSLAELRVDVSQGIGATGLGGGTNTGWVVGLPGGERSTLDLPPLVLPAGTTLGINLPFTGAADTTLSIYFIEE